MRKDMKKYYRIEYDQPKFNWVFGSTSILGYWLIIISTGRSWQMYTYMGFYFAVLLLSTLRIKSRTCKR